MALIMLMLAMEKVWMFLHLVPLLCYPTHSSFIFNLHHLLLVPSITKNLLSVHQFAFDNGVNLNFFLIIVLPNHRPTVESF